MKHIEISKNLLNKIMLKYCEIESNIVFYLRRFQSFALFIKIRQHVAFSGTQVTGSSNSFKKEKKVDTKRDLKYGYYIFRKET